MLHSISVLMCVFAVVFFYDAELRLRYVLYRRGLQERLDFITYNAPRLFFAVAKKYLDFRVIIEPSPEDERLPERFLVVCNHQSLLDIPVVFYRFRGKNIRFVAKKELGSWVPFVSQVLRYQRHCLIDRQANRIQSMKTIDSFAKRAGRNGWSPAIFPEGTRSRDGEVGTFHAAGVRRILELAPMPVAAVAIDGGWKVSTLGSLRKNVRHGRFRLRIVGVYEAPKGKAEIAGVLDAARTSIISQVERWHREAKPSVPGTGR